ncbi:MAG: multidrug effflux MFS transporter [Paracoccaceae bacterium]
MNVPASARVPRLSTLVFLTAISVLSLNMYLPSLAQIADDLNTSYGIANLSIAGYLAITGALQLIMGPLSDRYGRRPVILVGLVLFLAGSILAAIAPTIELFLVARVLQAAVISGLALSRAVVRDIVPADEAAGMLGKIGVAMALAPMLGPTIGGFLGDAFGWRSVFWLYAALGLAMLFLTYFDLNETNENQSASFAAQFRDYPQLFGSRRFWGYSVCLTFSTGGFYCYITAAPLVLPSEFGLGPSMLGVTMGVISLGFMAGNFVSGRLVMKFGLTHVMLAGRLLTVFGVGLGAVSFAFGFGGLTLLFPTIISVGFGNGLSIPTGNAGTMSVRPHLAGSASGVSGALVVAGGAMITGLTGTILNQDSGAISLLLLILGIASLGSLSAAYVIWVDQREGPPDA